MNVQQLMATKVKTCSLADTLNRAAELMWDGDCGCVPVVDGESHVMGILTDRDICMAAYTQGKALWELPVELAMNKKVWAIRPEETISAAEKLLAEKKVHRLPVVDQAGHLVGILSLSDIARQAACDRGAKRKTITDTEVGETVAAICEPRAAIKPRMVPEQPSKAVA